MLKGQARQARYASWDGTLGFWAALSEVFSTTKQQRCWVHKTANVLDKLPKSAQPRAKKMRTHAVQYLPGLVSTTRPRSLYASIHRTLFGYPRSRLTRRSLSVYGATPAAGALGRAGRSVIQAADGCNGGVIPPTKLGRFRASF